MGFLDRSRSLPLLIRPLNTQDALVVSSVDLMPFIGEPLQAVPTSVVSTISAVMPLSEGVMQGMGGQLFRLSSKSRQLLKTNSAVMKDGCLLGMVKNPKNAKIVGQLEFQPVGLAGNLVTCLPAVASAAALQMQLARIEKQLDAIKADLDYIIRQSHIQIEAQLRAAHGILDDVAHEVDRKGRVDDDAWNRLTEIEYEIRTLHYMAGGNLSDVLVVLSDPAKGLAARKRALENVLRDKRAAWWLRARINAEAALLRWEQLYLMRRICEEPDEIELIAERVRQDVLRRVEELRQLDYALRVWQERTSPSNRILERILFLQRRRLAKLRTELEPMLDAFPSALVSSLTGSHPHEFPGVSSQASDPGGDLPAS